MILGGALMAQFKYKAQTIDGKKVSGTMNAADQSELHQRLRDGELFLLSAKEVKSSKGIKQFKPRCWRISAGSCQPWLRPESRWSGRSTLSQEERRLSPKNGPCTKTCYPRSARALPFRRRWKRRRSISPIDDLYVPFGRERRQSGPGSP